MKEIKGNLFDQQVDVVCIATNGSVLDDGQAVMGCGRAMDAELLFPGLALLLGSAIETFGNHFHYLKYMPEQKYTVAAFPVREKWDGEIDLKLVEESCKDLAATIYMHDTKVALPRIGCGTGGKGWSEIKEIMAKHFDDRFVIVDPENL